MPSALEENPSLGDALYSALGLSARRLRFMAVFTLVVAVVPIAAALGDEPATKANAVVDVAAFVGSEPDVFTVESVGQAFVATVTSRASLAAAGEHLSMSIDALRAGIEVTAEDEGSARIVVAFTDADPDRAAEVAFAAARTALDQLADSRAAAADRNIAVATERLEGAQDELATFEAEVGATDVPAQYERLSALIVDLSGGLPASAAPEDVQEALAAAVEQRQALEPVIRQAEALDSERQGALEQLLAANEARSRADVLAQGSDATDVVRPGFTETSGRLQRLLGAAASGVFAGVLVSYLATWLLLRRRAG